MSLLYVDTDYVLPDYVVDFEKPVYAVSVEFNTSTGFIDVTSDVLRFNCERRLATAFEPLEAGIATLELDNKSRRWSPLNGAGPYFGGLLPNRRLRIQASIYGTTNNLFSGRTKMLSVNPAPEADTAVLEAVSDAERVSDAVITTSLFTGINPSSFFTEIMSKCSVQSFAADTIADTMEYAWADSENANGALNRLMTYGQYSMYEDGAGTFKLNGRYFGLLTSAVDSFTVEDNIWAVGYSLDGDTISNRVKVDASPLKPSAAVNTVAWVREAIRVPATAAVGFALSYVDPDVPVQETPANNLITPVASTDYLFNTSSDGFGTDLTNVMSVSVTFFGQSAVCSLYNPSSQDAYAVWFRLRGQSLQVQPKLQAEINVASSQTEYGLHAVAITNDYLTEKEFVDGYATILANDRKDPMPRATIAMKNHFQKQLARELSETVSVIESKSGVNSQWTIAAIRHDVALAVGLEHTTEYDLRYYSIRPWLVLDHATFGKLDSGRQLAF